MCRYASLAISGSTRRPYLAGKRRYLGFCAVCKWDPLSASDYMLSAFAAHIAGHVKPGAVRVYLVAVRNLHLDTPTPSDKGHKQSGITRRKWSAVANHHCGSWPAGPYAAGIALRNRRLFHTARCHAPCIPRLPALRGVYHACEL